MHKGFIGSIKTDLLLHQSIKAHGLLLWKNTLSYSPADGHAEIQRRGGVKEALRWGGRGNGQTLSPEIPQGLK